MGVCVCVCVCVYLCVCVLQGKKKKGRDWKSKPEYLQWLWLSGVMSIFFLFVCIIMCLLVAQSCLTLCDPMDCSPPGSTVHGAVQ